MTSISPPYHNQPVREAAPAETQAHLLHLRNARCPDLTVCSSQVLRLQHVPSWTWRMTSRLAHCSRGNQTETYTGVGLAGLSTEEMRALYIGRRGVRLVEWLHGPGALHFHRNASGVGLPSGFQELTASFLRLAGAFSGFPGNFPATRKDTKLTRGRVEVAGNFTRQLYQATLPGNFTSGFPATLPGNFTRQLYVPGNFTSGFPQRDLPHSGSSELERHAFEIRCLSCAHLFGTA